MLSDEFISAVEKAFSLEGFDLKVEFSDTDYWDEAISYTTKAIKERGVNYFAYHHTFKVEFLLDNGNLITLSYKPSAGEF